MGIIARTANRYWLGPMTNYPQIAAPGFATYQSAQAMWERFIASENLAFDGVSNCVSLTPRAEVRDMVLGEWSFTNAAQWSLCAPESASWQANYLLSHVSSPNVTTSATSRYLLPVAAGFAVDLFRASTPAGQSSPQRWRIAWGRGYALEFGGRDDTYLYGGTNRLTRDARADEVKGFEKDGLVRFDIRQVGYDLHVTCSAWRSSWIIQDVTRDLGGGIVGLSGYSPFIPAGAVTISGTGGMYGFSLQPYRYATSGTAVTPWFEIYGTRSASSAVKQSFLLPSPGGSAGAATLETSGSRGRFTISLAGDGWHTPYLGGWQAYWLPTFTTPTELWEEVTDQVRGEGMDFSLDGSASCDLTLDNAGGVTADSLFRGQMAFKAQIGYQTDGTDITYDRLQGIATTLGQSSPVNNDDTVSIHVVDRKKQLSDVELFFAPCLLGMDADDALSLLLQWAGISGLTTDVSAIATLDDPGRNYDNPPWLPAMGTTAREMIDRICSTYDYRLEAWHGDGVMRLVDYWPTGSPVIGYDSRPGADETLTITDITTEDDFTDAKNMVVTIGQDVNGRAVYATMIDPLGLSRMGYLAGVTDTNSDLTTQAAVNRACRALYTRRARSRRALRLASDHATLWDRLPGDIITITDPQMGYEDAQYVVTKVNLTLGDEVISTTLDAEELTP